MKELDLEEEQSVTLAESGGLKDREETKERLRKLAKFYDSAFGIPGTSFRVGWDSIIGLVPGIGDLVGVAPLVYYLRIARRHQLGGGVYMRLVFNQGVDFVLGSIPLVGDLFDWAFKANVKNADLLIRHLDRPNN